MERLNQTGLAWVYNQIFFLLYSVFAEVIFTLNKLSEALQVPSRMPRQGVRHLYHNLCTY